MSTRTRVAMTYEESSPGVPLWGANTVTTDLLPGQTEIAIENLVAGRTYYIKTWNENEFGVKSPEKLSIVNTGGPTRMLPLVFSSNGVFDQGSAMYAYIKVPEDVISISSVSVTLSFRAFFASATAASSGGGSTSGSSSAGSSGASSSATSDGSPHFHIWGTQTSAVPGAYSNQKLVDGAGGNFNIQTTLGAGNAHLTESESFGGHTHGMAHTHGIPHTHTTPDHVHGLTYGTFEETYPTSHEVFMNLYHLEDGVWVFKHTFGNLTRDLEDVDLTDWLSGPGDWRMAIASAPGTPNNGRLAADVYGSLIAIIGDEGGDGGIGVGTGTGADGADGAPGADGATGADGRPGADGADGEDGPMGPPGERGPTGATGSTGPRGLQGDHGIDGSDGDDGPPGPPGERGSAGPTGSTGPAGAAGPQGPAGVDGEDGADGRPGADGAAGAAGAAGARGFDGRPGYDGVDGDDGVPGPPGERGAQGIQGNTGSTGAPGADGRPGIDGQDGEDGQPGQQGPTGFTGPQGPFGPIGPVIHGIDGDDGEQGPPGMQGMTGATGAQGTTGATGQAGAGAMYLYGVDPMDENATDISIPPMQWHGAEMHNDVTRQYGLDAHDSGLGGTATLIQLGASPNFSDALNLPDAATSGGYWSFMVPMDFVSSLAFAPVWTPAASDAVAHTVRWSQSVKGLTAAQDVTAAGVTTAFTGSSAVRTVNIVVVEAATAAGFTPTPGQWVRLNMQRIGADAADTYVGAVRLIGVTVSYTASG